MVNSAAAALGVGDDVSWVSAAGYLRGKIVQINISLNAAHKLVPWITIERTLVRPNGEAMPVRTRLCATDGSLKMMQVTQVFEDIEPKTWVFNNYIRRRC